LGWLALCLPEDAGGLGGSTVDIALLMIELGRGMTVEPIVSSVLQCGRLLVDARWPGRSNWLDDLISATRRMAFANREHADRAEQPRARVTALQPTASGFALSGAKLMVWDGDSADAFLVSATHVDTRELVLVTVRREARGVGVRSYTLIDGSHAADLFLDQVEVQEQDIVADGVSAEHLLDDALMRARLAGLAAMVGSMETCIDLCTEYLKARWQFGQPLGKFQSLQHMLAQMLLTAHNARSMLYYALSKSEVGRADRRAAIDSAGHLISEAGLTVSRSAIQLHGGYGITDEYAIGHHYRFLFTLDKRFAGSV
jgi:alkylation response protein AidB-like acyl-CoA dehydrogenase